MKNILFSVILMFFTLGVNGQFSEAIMLDESIAGEILTADFDGDGLPDVVSLNKSCYLLRNQPSGIFAPGEYLFGFEVQNWSGIHGSATDTDLDGDPDIVLATHNGDSYPILQIHLNDGTGNFSLSQEWSCLTTSFDVVHHNDDEYPDITMSTQTSIGMLVNLGDGTFYYSGIFILEDYPHGSVGAVDANDDGYSDLVLFTGFDSAYQYYLALNYGDGTYAAPQLFYEDAFSTGFDFRLADINDDGISDMVFRSVGRVIWLTISEQGLIEYGGTLQIETGNYSISYAIADPDNDNDADIIVVEENNIEVMVFEHIGPGMFVMTPVPHELVPIFGDFRSVSMADMNGDDHVDLVFSMLSYGVCYFTGNGNLEWTNRIDVSKHYYQINEFTVGDMNGDGANDLIVNDRIQFYMSNDFRTSYTTLNDLLQITQINDALPQQEVWNSYLDIPLRVIDFDDDGDLDHLELESDAGSSLRLWRNMNGTFVPEYIVLESAENLQLVPVIIDWNDDGIMDLYSKLSSNAGIVHLGTENGTYIPSFNFSEFLEPEFFADIDGDGDPDAFDIDEASVWRRNEGNNSWSTAIEIDSEWHPGMLSTTIDWDEDGDTDILGYINPNGAIFWYENLDGNGTFAPRQYIEVLYGEAESLTSLDADNDGDLDVVCSSSTGLFWIENVPGAGFQEGVLISEDVSTGTLMAADMNSDGSEDLLLKADNFYVFLNLNSYVYQASGRVYIDSNENGVFDDGEQPAPFIEINTDGPILAQYTNTQGEFTIYLLPGDHQISAEIPALWNLTSDNETFDFTLDDLIPVAEGLNFGVAPSIIQDSLSIHYFSPASICTTPVAQWISVTNWGTTNPSGIVSLELDPSMSFISSSITPDSIVGNTIYWSFEELGYFGSAVFPAEISHPGVDMLGLEMFSSAEVCINDESICMQEDLLSVIECSYDPNIIIADPEGWTSQGYVLADTDMLYTIYFQNLGNAPAQDVRIENALPGPLDAQELTFISSSHPVTSMYVDESEMLHIRLDGIMLPDSASDAYGSQGFVSYLIPMDVNLAVNTEIENTATIYFDQNEPVVTNTTIHTIFSCDGLGEFTVMGGNCFGENIEAMANEGLIETYSWSVNDVSAGNSETLTYEPENPGQFEITLTVSNPLCNAATSQVIESLLPVIPVISANDNILTCSGAGIFSWYLNGNLVYQGSDNSITSQGDGVYIVELTTENGCHTSSEPFVYSGIQNMAMNGFLVYPNPAESQLFIRTWARWSNIEIHDMEGRTIRRIIGNELKQGTTTIDLSSLDAGCYLVVMENADGTQQQLIVVR